MLRKHSLPIHQQAFAQRVAELGLASLDEALTAFERRDEDQLNIWRSIVYAAQDTTKTTSPSVSKKVQCAWCGTPIDVPTLEYGRVPPTLVRTVYLAYDQHTTLVEQHGCSLACQEQIRVARVTIALNKEIQS